MAKEKTVQKRREKSSRKNSERKEIGEKSEKSREVKKGTVL
jgi:hypothetical protein